MADGVYEVCFHGGDTSGNEWMNRWNFSVTGSDPDADALATARKLADIFGDTIDTAFFACLPTDVFRSYITARRVDGPSATFIDPLEPHSGDRAGSLSSLVMAPLIVHYCSAAINHIGKTFMPGVNQGDLQNSRLSNALLVDLAALCLLFNDELTIPSVGGTGKMCVYTKTTMVAHIVTSSEARSLCHSLRRRVNPNMIG